MVCCGSVEIEDRKIEKPYLGGWRHKISKVEYLNAESQTGPLRMPAKETCSKKVQYIAVEEVGTQTRCDHPTQMWRNKTLRLSMKAFDCHAIYFLSDCFISSEKDKYLTSKPYETYEEMMRRLDYDGKARIIQRNYRIYKLLKYIKEYARQYRELVKDCQIYERDKLMMYQERHRQEILRRTNPQSRLDFDLLYDLVEKWQRDRFDCAKQRFFRAGRCAENYLILNKAVEMFNVIDQKRQAVQARYRKRKRVKFLTVNCKSVIWHGYKAKLVEMITMRNQKARELRAIYDLLMNYDVTLGERIEILTMLKKSLELHNCVAAFHLIKLLEQESAFLARGLKDIPLDYFRERIVYSYLCFLRSSHSCCCVNNDEDFCKNVDDEKLREPTELKTKVCKSCSKLLPHHKFTVHGRMKSLSTCIERWRTFTRRCELPMFSSKKDSRCTWLRERNTVHVNYDPYIFLLVCVRSAERARNSPSAIAFIMQKHDIYHLVHNIWHGRSVVSENKDLFKLKMIRYHVNEEWSPWNCILLTEEEAEVHARIEDLQSVYSKPLIKKVRLCHQVAKNHFKHLMKFEKEFREKFHKIEDKIEYNINPLISTGKGSFKSGGAKGCKKKHVHVSFVVASARFKRIAPLSQGYIKSKNNELERAFDRSTKQVANGNAGFKALSFQVVRRAVRVHCAALKARLFLSLVVFFGNSASLLKAIEHWDSLLRRLIYGLEEQRKKGDDNLRGRGIFVMVLISSTTKPKPFLGGWRSKATGIVYCHACTQTGQDGQDSDEKITQTVFTADKSTATRRDASVQVDFFPDVRDRFLEARKSRSTQDWSFKDPSKEKILESVVKIQRFYRAHRRAASQSSSVSTKDTDEEQIPGEPGSYRGRDFVILNRTSPRTRTDFELLYNLLDRWRICETERASQLLFDPSRIALCSLILSKEVELLRAIDSLKAVVKLRARERAFKKFLDELSRPVVWTNRRGEPIFVDTLRVQRARRFRDTFHELSKQDIPTQERVEILSRVRSETELHTCKASDDVVRLLDQEIDLLVIDVDESKLNWLRNRLKIAFLILARDALANDLEDASLIGWPSSSRKTICRSCGRLLPIEKFPREKRRRSSCCNYCLYVKVREGPRVVYGPYTRLLRGIRRSELKMGCHNSVAFAIDEKIVYHLVNDIWQGKSAISENDRLEELKLVRFRRDVEWSPWNCLLLTSREASVHRKVDDPDKFYGPMILQKFHTKNLQAKVQFESVIEIQRSRGKRV
ncbi:uncharacterized protein LOC143186282 [Calliopsis andreniformis]|uniref:uncharacterized protein LOC143186282 n=1 Tax=Calliopsis andreniformis TaxID=337506 RepID=UPI003FCCF7D1